MHAGDTILVIGATSSLAQSLCRALASQGYGLMLIARDETELDLLAADLRTRFGAACQTLAIDIAEPTFNATESLGQLVSFDHAVIAVGDMGGHDPDSLPNIGYTAALNYVLPAQIGTVLATHMANSTRGTLAFVSSVAGDRGKQSNYHYGAAKAALTAFASGLRNRYQRQGVHVMTIKPGFVDTPMTWGMQSPLIGSREDVAEAIVRGMKRRANTLYAPWFWRVIMAAIGLMPEAVFKRLRL